MKRLTCELCGSTSFIKKDGVYECKDCGTQYTLEEAKKMMIEGTVEVEGTVKIDNSAQIKNYLDLSQNAYDGGNGQSAFDYANKALEISPQNPYAWIAKMKSIEYIGTLGNLKLMEVVEAGKNAVQYASEDEKKEITDKVYRYELIRALSLLTLATTKMNDTEDIEATFKQFALISILSAGKNTLLADSKIVSIYDGIANEAMGMILLVPDEVLADNLELAKLVGECAKQYQFVTDALIARYKIYGASLTDEAIRVRKQRKELLEEKASKAESIALEKEAEESKARKEAYWAGNAELKKKLESERTSLQSKIKEYNLQIESLTEGTKVNEIETQIADLHKKRNALGLFKGNEKKALQVKIDELTSHLTKAKEAYDAVVTPINESISKLEERITEIDTEFEKER